jgi:hypothetical protein
LKNRPRSADGPRSPPLPERANVPASRGLQLAADILSTSVAATWDRIGKLAAIAVIRTALNHFHSMEVRSEAADEDRHAGDAQRIA